MLYHKIIHIIFQHKCNYVASMILQIIVQCGTRATGIFHFLKKFLRANDALQDYEEYTVFHLKGFLCS